MAESIFQRAEKMVCLISGKCLIEWEQKEYKLEKFLRKELEEAVHES